MYKPEELVEIVFDQSRRDPMSLTTLVDRVPPEKWSEITGWNLEVSEKSGRYVVEPAILGAALVNFYPALLEVIVGPELYEAKYMEDARRIKSALGSLESADIAVVAGRDAQKDQTREAVIERSSTLLFAALSSLAGE